MIILFIVAGYLGRGWGQGVGGLGYIVFLMPAPKPKTTYRFSR